MMLCENAWIIEMCMGRYVCNANRSMCAMCGICMLGMRCGWIVCMMLCGMCEGEGNNIVCKPLWAERVLFWNKVVQI